MTEGRSTSLHPGIPRWPLPSNGVRRAMEAMLEDGSWGRYHGPHRDALVERLCRDHAVQHALLCSSGTCAVELALRAAGVDGDSEVILCAYDFKANFVNAVLLNATPVLVDSLPGVPVPDPHEIAAAISPKTRAIICSHLHGSLAPIRQIADIAKQHSIVLIEDACQCPGALIGDRPAGSFGDVSVLSFGGSKLLSAGRGGAVLTNDDTLAQRIRLYVRRGNEAYPLSEMQAAVLVPQLDLLSELNQHRWKAVRVLLKDWPESARLQPAMLPAPNVVTGAKRPSESSRAAPGDEAAPGQEAASSNASLNAAPTDDVTDDAGAFDGPDFRPDHVSGEPGVLPVFYKVAFRLSDAEPASMRDALCERAQQAGIPLYPGFAALHRIHSKRRFRCATTLKHADDLHERLLTLHHPVLLADAKTLQYVADTLRSL